MKKRFAALFMAALISMFGAAACADRLQQEAEQRARDEIDKQIEKGRQEVEKLVETGRTEAEKRLQEGRQQIEKKVNEGQ